MVPKGFWLGICSEKRLCTSLYCFMIIKALLVFSREEYLIKGSHLNTDQKELKKASFDASVWIIAKFAAFFVVEKATIAVVMVEKYRVSMILHFIVFIGNGNETAPKYKVKAGKFNLAMNLTNTKKDTF